MRRMLIIGLALMGLLGQAAARGAPSPWQKLAEGRYAAGSVAKLKAAGFTIDGAKVVWYAGLNEPPAGRNGGPEAYYVNNPLTVYGGVKIPVGADGTAMSDVFQLNGDDVIAMYGTTPPALTYYSITMNEFARYRPDTGKMVKTNSSVALSINNANIGTTQGRPFDANFVLIIAAQRAAAQNARDFFLAQGVPAGSINTILYPHRFTRQSNTTTPPTLNVLSRLTFRTQAEEDAMKAYIGRPIPAMGALYFKGSGTAGDVEDSELVPWENQLRIDTSEFGADTVAGLDLLTQRVQAHFAGLGYQVLAQATEVNHHIDPQLNCRDLYKTCNYDAPDALYGRFFCQRGGATEPQLCTGVLPDANRRAVIVGLNHHRFGQDKLMTYYSYAVTRITDLQGIATLSDLQVEGSAAQFLPDLPNADDFFVLSLSRDCGQEQFCMQIPYNDDPDVPGLPTFGPVEITTRLYLDKVTGTAPNPANFLPARLFWLKR